MAGKTACIKIEGSVPYIFQLPPPAFKMSESTSRVNLLNEPKPMVGGGGGIASGIATSTYKHNVDNCACGTCHKS